MEPKRNKIYKDGETVGRRIAQASPDLYDAPLDDLSPGHVDKKRRQGTYQERNPQYSGGQRLSKGVSLKQNRDRQTSIQQGMDSSGLEYNEGRGIVRDDMGDMAPKVKPKMKIQSRKYTNNKYTEGE